MSNESNKLKRGLSSRIATCFGCRTEIFDQYILQVAPDMEWHASCLKCAECHQFLDENCTCFVREKKTYCKRDYLRLFAAKCAKCSEGFNKNDFVMRARNKIYHPDCFCCDSCSRPLVSGDEFALRDDQLLCKADHEVIEKGHFVMKDSSLSDGDINGNNISPNSNHSSSSSNSGKLHLAVSAEPIQVSSHRNHHREHHSHIRSHVHKHSSEHKPTRVRTVLNEKQLQTLRNCYNQNPRPDALMKEQLVEMTGLSPRVIRVWFQNKRCKDKKRSILMKQIQQQEKDGRQLQNIANMRGVPMVASSPVRHESPVQVPIEVQSYQPPWKAFADYAMHHSHDAHDPSAPHFQHLINQMHGCFDVVGLGPLPPAEPHLVPGSGGGGMPSLTYLSDHDHDLHNSHSNLSHSSQMAGTHSGMSSPCHSE